ncbi:hypothetical protein Fmac_010133 [Flemingia macrophylla]|uniref:Leucine-rich repeat domain, L domain-containing protein n=1 Tax=Flemingia macrophylla TaxID=520843 RepID=A0ABD1N263_9FABA
MTSLRVFRFDNYRPWLNRCHVYLPEVMDSWSDKLEYFHWDGYCLNSLSSNFCAEQLVVLRMRYSKLKKLWDGVQNLENLKEIDLLGSKHLTDIPDLSKATKLESVNLYGCESLHQLHLPSLSDSKLRYLNLDICREIKSVNVHSKYLRQLGLYGCSFLKEISVTSEEITKFYLSGCKEIERVDLHSKRLVILELNGCLSLKEISVVSEEITKLGLSGTAITSFSSISSFPKLTYLDLSCCVEIEILDLQSKSLGVLNLRDCLSLKKISITSDELRRLDLEGMSMLESLNVNSRPLENLNLRGCSSIKEISVVSEEITKLDLSGTAITSLSSSISSISKLRYLDLSNCKNLVSLRELPSSALYGLKAYNCISLETEITQRLVLQHMLKTTIPYLHQSRHRKFWDRDNADEDDFFEYFGFPGDHVVDECVFQTRESSISIPCYKLKMTHISGFIYCIVLSQGSPSLSYRILVSIYPIWNTRDSWNRVYKRNGLISYHHLISDHVVFCYHGFSKFDGMSKVYDHSKDVEIKFQLLDLKDIKGFGALADVEGFGVFPVYVTTSGYNVQISESQFIEPEQPSTSKRRST